MAFFTCMKSSVPLLGDYEDGAGGALSPLDSALATPTPSHQLTGGLSTETVDTLTEDDLQAVKERSSSQNSTPTPAKQIERFVYEVDPELGAFV